MIGRKLVHWNWAPRAVSDWMVYALLRSAGRNK